MAWSLPRLLRRLHPALAHFQHVVAPRYEGRAVLTIHDLSFEHDPSLMPPRDRFFFRTMVPRSVRRADLVLAVSERTKCDLVDHYRVSPEKVVVIPNGVDPVFSPNGSGTRESDPYVLFVGALNARKDPVTAIEALSLAVDDLRLVMTGPDKGKEAEARAAVSRLGLENRVDFTGHVDKDELAVLYRDAECFVLPSRYEGFGLPIVEAMASGTPVVTTTAGALPEVAADAAILVEPGDPTALAAGIEQAIADRERLVAAGLRRARRFSWAQTARRTLEVYRELL